MIGLICGLCLAAQARSQATLVGRPAPAFDAIATSGRRVSPGTLRGKPWVLFVFCSCRECKLVAEGWAKTSFDKKPATVVAYADTSAATKAFAMRVGLTKQGALLFSDEQMKVAGSYRAMPCPSVYVVDKNGFIRYSSKESAGELEASAVVLVGQVVAALSPKRLAGGFPKLPPVKQSGSAFLTISGGTAKVADGEYEWHASEIDPAKAATITHTFLLVNDTKVALDIEQVLSSCGCQETTLFRGGSEVARASLKPGRSIDLRVSFTYAGGRSGKTVSVWLYNKSIRPLATLRMIVGP
jgi:peroxiredoxin